MESLGRIEKFKIILNLKITKEQVIALGLAIVKDIFKEKANPVTAEIEWTEVSLYALGQEGYYAHDGWLFKVDSEKIFGNEAMTFLISFLDNGIPLDMVSVLGDDKPRTLYAIKGEDGHYKPISEQDFFKHHNFDFTKGFEKKMF
jgi:hypothetical protein